MVSALRNLLSGQRIDPHPSEQLLTGLADRTRRVWDLRHNFNAYDAVYIALADETDSVLYTGDAKLCKGHHAQVVLFTH